MLLLLRGVRPPRHRPTASRTAATPHRRPRLARTRRALPQPARPAPALRPAQHPTAATLAGQRQRHAGEADLDRRAPKRLPRWTRCRSTRGDALRRPVMDPLPAVGRFRASTPRSGRDSFRPPHGDLTGSCPDPRGDAGHRRAAALGHSSWATRLRRRVRHEWQILDAWIGPTRVRSMRSADGPFPRNRIHVLSFQALPVLRTGTGRRQHDDSLKGHQDERLRWWIRQRRPWWIRPWRPWWIRRLRRLRRLRIRPARLRTSSSLLVVANCLQPNEVTPLSGAGGSPPAPSP